MSMQRSQAAAVVLLVIWTLAASAATVLGYSMQELTRAAPVVVRGTVLQQQHHVPEGSRRVFTDTELRVTESLKGSVDGAILVRQPGGPLDGVYTHVEGAANFVEGEDVILFLSASKSSPGVFLPLTLAASKVSLVEKVGELRAIRRLDGLAFAKPGTAETIRAIGGEEDLGEADAFLAQLRAWAREAR